MNGIISSQALRWAATSVLIGVTVSQLRLGDIWHAGANAHGLAAIALAAAAFLLVVLLNGLRWRLVAGSIGFEISAVDAARWTLIGHFFNQVLPSSVGGDVLRAWLAGEQSGKRGLAATSVALERLVGLAAVVALILAGQPILISRLGDSAPSRLVFLGLLAGCGVVLGGLLLDRILGAQHFRRARDVVRSFRTDLQRLVAAPSALVITLVLSLTMNVLNLGVTAVIANDLGAHVSVVEIFLVVPTVLLLASLPISIGGWGVREAALAVGFSAIGQSPSIAVATSVLIGIANLVSAVPGAILWIALPGRGIAYSKVKRLDRSAAPSLGGPGASAAGPVARSND